MFLLEKRKDRSDRWVLEETLAFVSGSSIGHWRKLSYEELEKWESYFFPNKHKQQRRQIT